MIREDYYVNLRHHEAQYYMTYLSAAHASPRILWWRLSTGLPSRRHDFHMAGMASINAMETSLSSSRGDEYRRYLLILLYYIFHKISRFCYSPSVTARHAHAVSPWVTAWHLFNIISKLPYQLRRYQHIALHSYYDIIATKIYGGKQLC